MTPLRDALAASVRDIAWNAYFRLGNPTDKVPDSQDCADAILSDPAFRLALTEAIAEALVDRLGVEHYWRNRNTDETEDAAAIVARMLGETP